LKNYHDGGEAILEAFRNLNIEYVISSPGSEWPSFWEAMARQKQSGAAGPIYLDCGHETIAVTMAAAYTHITGRMQAVLLHAGAGLLQGSMAIGAARAMETPMLVMSGESAGYGEAEFDPGSQWYRNLSIVGGPQRLLEPVVKWALQAPSPETLYQSVVRVGEVAQRTPRGPTYIGVSMETMLHEWLRPEQLRKIPPAPKLRPTSADIEKIAALLANAKCPIISVENAGPDQKAFDALIELAELLAIRWLNRRARSSPTFRNLTTFTSVRISPRCSQKRILRCWSRAARPGTPQATHRRTRRSWRSARTRSRPTWFTR
jgi:acetolactate synthase-1/2/3 large subunit